MYKYLIYLFIISFTSLLAGCTLEESTSSSSLKSSRTILFYMGGDNNLSGELSEKLMAIQQFAKSSEQVREADINLIIYQDSPSGAKLYRAVFGQNMPEVVSEYGIENSSSAVIFNRVLQDCIHTAPADSYGLVVFSHASGWLPTGTLNVPRSVGSRSVIIDNGLEMDIKDFASAIPEQTFDYVIFEACYMACVEVAYELRSKVQYVVASPTEMLSPGFTNIYPQLLAVLCNSQFNTPTMLCNAAQLFFNHYNAKTDINRAATVSVLRTAELESLAQFCRRIASQLSTVTPQTIQYFDRNATGRHLFFDLEDCVSHCAPEVSAELRSLLAKIVLLKASTPQFLLSEGGFTIDTCCGLSIYIQQEQFPYINSEYRKLQWNEMLN